MSHERAGIASMNIFTAAIVGAALIGGGALWSGGNGTSDIRCNAYPASDGRGGRQGADTPAMLRAFAAADMTEALTPREELDHHPCTK